MVDIITKKELDQLMTNFQELEKDNDPPATYRATFRLSNILHFLSEIAKLENFVADDGYTHNIAITFVREDLSNKVLGYQEKKDSNLSINKINHNGKEYSRVIPIITGCVARLDDNYILKSYDDLTVDKKGTQIPFVRSGGEGTGLIPPPPKGR